MHQVPTQQTFTCSKSTIETLKKVWNMLKVNTIFRSSRPEVFCKKGVLKDFAKFTGKHLCQRLFFCEFCEISKNNFFTEHLRWLLFYFCALPKEYRVARKCKNEANIFARIYILSSLKIWIYENMKKIWICWLWDYEILRKKQMFIKH